MVRRGLPEAVVREAVVRWEAWVLLRDTCCFASPRRLCDGAKDLSKLALAMQNLFSPDMFRNVPHDGAEAQAAPTHHQPHPPT